MSIASGSRLGPYEIVAQIGAGGMGEVYRSAMREASRSHGTSARIEPGRTRL
jgi:hypothetical protein